MSSWVRAENLFNRRKPWSDMSILLGIIRDVAVGPLPEAAMNASSTFVVGKVVISIEPELLQTLQSEKQQSIIKHEERNDD